MTCGNQIEAMPPVGLLTCQLDDDHDGNHRQGEHEWGRDDPTPADDE